MRCFVAVDIEAGLKPEIIKLQSALNPLINGNIVDQKNLHFTLKFLGEIDENQIESVKIKLKEVTSNFRPFDINIAGVGAFPNKNYVKVIWIGAPKLFNLQKAVCDALPEFSQDHEIIPHLTLARVKNVQNKSKLATLMESHENTVFGSMLVSNIKLKKSVLKPSGPAYEDLAVLELSAESK